MIWITKRRGQNIVFSWLVLAIAVFAPPVSGQVWKKKDFNTWSRSDCRQLLDRSPWANDYMIATVVIEPITPGDPTTEGRDPAPYITYTARFWSAAPIRKAIIRLQQLQSRYRDLAPEQRKAFDEQGAEFVAAEFPDTVVIQLSYSTVPAYSIPLARFWQSRSQEHLKNLFYLNGRPGKVSPLQVIVQPGRSGGGLEFQLIFPRRPNGIPMADTNLKQLVFEIDHPEIDQVSKATRVLITFPVKKMYLGDEIVY